MIHDYDDLSWQEQNALEEKAKKRPALLLKTELPSYSTGNYGHIRASFVWLHPKDDKPRNYRSESPLSNLVVSSQMDETTAQNYQAGERRHLLYGWTVEYKDAYTVDLSTAETFVKTLRRIARRLDKLSDDQGHPADFAAYVARVAQILGAKQGIHKLSGEAAEYSANEWQTGSIGDLVHWVRLAEQNIIEAYG